MSYLRSELLKSQIYMEVVRLFTRGLVRLPDHARLLRELRLLERRTHRGGKVRRGVFIRGKYRPIQRQSMSAVTLIADKGGCSRIVR